MTVMSLPRFWRQLYVFALSSALLGAGCAAESASAGGAAMGPGTGGAAAVGGASEAATGGQQAAGGDGGSGGGRDAGTGDGGSPTAGAPAGGTGGTAATGGMGGSGGAGGSAGEPTAGSAGAVDGGAAEDAGVSIEVAGRGGFPGEGGLWSNTTTASASATGALTEADVQACLPLPASDDASDENADGSSCMAANCAALRSCCVGDGTCCTDIDVIDVPPVVNFADCDGTDPVECMTQLGWTAEGFGPRSAAVHGDALYPGGDETGDSGLVFSSPLDLTSHRVRVSATFGAASSCREDCLEGVGVGFTSKGAQEPLPAHVSGDISLVYSGSLGQIRLMMGGNVVGQTPMTEQQERWTLELQPSGRARVFAERAPADAMFDVPYSPRAASRLMVFGINRDPSREDGARLLELAVQVALCDIPGGWRDREELTIRSYSREWRPATVASPSVAYDSSGQALLAFEVDGAIHLARRSSDYYDGIFQLQGTTISPELSASAVRNDLGSEVTALRDPWLLWEGDRWVMYFAVERQGQGSELAEVQLQADGSFGPAQSLVFQDSVGELDAPSVVIHERGYWVMAAREKTDDGESLAIFALLADGVSWKRSAIGNFAQFLADAAAADPNNFYAGGVDSPSLGLQNGAWQLYFAGRRGTRWAIGLLVSDDLLRWRQVPATGPVLAPSGTGFERLAVTQPSVVTGNSGVELFYVGSDGHRNGIGRAWRASSDYGPQTSTSP